MSVDTGRGTYKRNSLTTYDWESTYTKYLDGSDVNTSTNRITWNTHGMRDKYTVIFQTPYQGLTDMGIASMELYSMLKMSMQIQLNYIQTVHYHLYNLYHL